MAILLEGCSGVSAWGVWCSCGGSGRAGRAGRPPDGRRPRRTQRRPRRPCRTRGSAAPARHHADPGPRATASGEKDLFPARSAAARCQPYVPRSWTSGAGSVMALPPQEFRAPPHRDPRRLHVSQRRVVVTHARLYGGISPFSGRRRGDSNSRGVLSPTFLAGRRTRPLCDVSIPGSTGGGRSLPGAGPGEQTARRNRRTPRPGRRPNPVSGARPAGARVRGRITSRSR